ncbi:N-formyl-4-amino-5-aminomethyl-2-methylpyrimidine deformylase [subsurface metagenome]
MESIQKLEQRWAFEKNHPLFKSGHFVLHPGTIKGGPYVAMTPWVVSEFCTIDYAIWFPPDEDPENVKSEIEDYIGSISKMDLWLEQNPPEIEWKLYFPSSSVNQDHPLVQACAQAHAISTGEVAKIEGFRAVCDATWLNKKGIPTIIYGPGDLIVAHAENEYVEIKQVMDAAKTYASLIMNWCGLQ